MSSIYRPITDILAGIARDRLGVTSLDRLARGVNEVRQVPVVGIGQALGDAYEAGFRAAIAEELGVLDVTYRHEAERFPWQVFCTEERCVLVSRDLKDHMLIGSEMGPGDTHLRVPVEGVRLELLEVVRRELYGARR